MRKKIAIYGLGLVIAIGHASFAWVTLDRDLRGFESGDRLDLEGHGWDIILLDAPVAIPVLLGMQALGYGYGEDDTPKAQISDLVLVAAGTLYWFVGGVFAGRLLMTTSTRSALVFGLTTTAALMLLMYFGRGPIVLLMLLGITPLLLVVTYFVVEKTNLLKYEPRAIT
jgi:hypothetical protein